MLHAPKPYQFCKKKSSRCEAQNLRRELRIRHSSVARKRQKNRIGVDGNKYKVEIKVDDDPFTGGVQINSAKTLKEVSVTVTLDRPTPGWQTAVPVTAILRRVRSN